MMIKAYNVKNHKLNYEENLKLERFNSNDYAGALWTSDDFMSLLTVTENEESVSYLDFNKSKINFLSGGLNFAIEKQPSDNGLNIKAEANKLYFFLINNASTDSFKYDNAASDSIMWSEIEIRVLDIDASFMPTEKTTVKRILNGTEEAEGISFLEWKFVFNSVEYAYSAKTLYTPDGKMILPLCYCTSEDGELKVVQIAANLSKSSYEDFLTASALKSLQTKLDERYTHQSGGSEQHPTWGNVGNFRIISNDGSTDVYHNSTKVAEVNQNNDVIVSKAEPLTKQAIFAEDQQITFGVLSVEAGGTGATSKATAKLNLGIFFDTDEPPRVENNTIVNGKYSGTAVSVGDLYFRIVE